MLLSGASGDWGPRSKIASSRSPPANHEDQVLAVLNDHGDFCDTVLYDAAYL